MTRFVLLSTQRSGSTWVIDMLNSHPQIAAYSELFLENGQGTPTWGGAKDVVFWATYLAANRDRARSAGTRELLFHYLDELYTPRSAVRAIGFKLMYGQAGAHPDLYDYLVSKGISVAHLIRKNLLDILISKEAAASRDVYHARIGDQVPRAHVRLDTSHLLDRLSEQERDVQKARERFARSGLPYREVEYEELRSDPAAFDVLLEFLGVERGPRELDSSLRRINTAPRREIIENYESVRRTLEGTRFAGFLR